jgi:hypothetical protein
VFFFYFVKKDKEHKVKKDKEYTVKKDKAAPRFELGNRGFAIPCLTTWLYRLYYV